MKCFRPIRSLVTLKFPAIDNIFHIFFCCQKLRGGGGRPHDFLTRGGGGSAPSPPPPGSAYEKGIGLPLPLPQHIIKGVVAYMWPSAKGVADAKFPWDYA